MYESYFSLREPAFSLTPDTRFLWLSETHEEGLAALCYGIARRKGFVLLTGGVGAGKTTLLRAALRSVSHDEGDRSASAVVVSTVGLSALDLLQLIAAAYGIAGGARGAADHLIAVDAFLRDRHRSGLGTVLVVDEAQNLSSEALEQLRLLSNLETETEKLLQIVLAGQPELRRKLAEPELRPLRQRIAVDHDVEPLTPGEVLPYLRHRIEVAGGRYEQIFEPDVDRVFAEFCSGCPRLINLLADRVLLAAYAKELRPISPAFVESKALETVAARAGAAPQGEDG